MAGDSAQKMATEPNFNEVEQGYYVYLHKDKDSGVPFYVGKGKQRRAYSKEGHNWYWHEKVNSLKNGYVVEIVKDNLTELEACSLEQELIQKYGKTWNKTGPLVNLTDGAAIEGGEIICGFSIILPESIQKALEESDAQKKYKDLSSSEISDIASSLLKEMKVMQDTFYTYHDSDTETDYEIDLQMCIDQMLDSAKLLLKHKIVYRDFTIDLEDARDDIELELKEISESKEKKEMVSLGQKLYRLLNSTVERIK